MRPQTSFLSHVNNIFSLRELDSTNHLLLVLGSNFTCMWKISIMILILRILQWSVIKILERSDGADRFLVNGNVVSLTRFFYIFSLKVWDLAFNFPVLCAHFCTHLTSVEDFRKIVRTKARMKTHFFALGLPGFIFLQLFCITVR